MKHTAFANVASSSDSLWAMWCNFHWYQLEMENWWWKMMALVFVWWTQNNELNRVERWIIGCPLVCSWKWVIHFCISAKFWWEEVEVFSKTKEIWINIFSLLTQSQECLMDMHKPDSLSDRIFTRMLIVVKYISYLQFLQYIVSFVMQYTFHHKQKTIITFGRLWWLQYS